MHSGNRGANASGNGSRSRNRRKRGHGLATVSAAVLALLIAGEGMAQSSQRTVDLGASLTLSRTAELALERNRDILNSRHQLNLAGEQVSEAWGDVYPRVDFSGSFTRNVAPQVSFLPAQIFDPNAPEGEFIPIQF
ncbi:MAG: TolC family protein, partial [Gemmatimonadota bacterium]|nr:TolC family protein [Gemmatimonadota bacterium]